MNKNTKKLLYEILHDDVPYILVAAYGIFIMGMSDSVIPRLDWDNNKIVVYYLFFVCGALIGLISLGLWYSMNNIQRRLIQENAAQQPATEPK